jgi:peptidoglycan DL-endopeptidase CwlO
LRKQRKRVLGYAVIVAQLSVVLLFAETPVGEASSMPVSAEVPGSIVASAVRSDPTPSDLADIESCAQMAAEKAYASGIDTHDELARSGIGGRPAEIIAELINTEIASFGLPAATVLTCEEQSHIKEWAPRLNTYLEGTPLAGKGAYFALSAYRHGVDPRISPAIAMKESGLGRKCFRSFNAWGMMGHSFASWEEGIDANHALIARLGGSITQAFARKYCPPTASHWHAFVVGQMKTI